MTSILRSVSFFALLAIWLAPFPLFAQQKASVSTRSQQAVSMDLVSSDRAVMASAFEEYLRVSEEDRTPQLRAALVDALAIENERRRKYLLGEGPHWALGPDDAIGLTLSGEVMRMFDPAYIDVLLPWLCCGGYPDWIDMGQEAIRPVLQFVYANEPVNEGAMNGGLHVLTMMVDHWGLNAFNSAEQEQLREIALRYISNEDDLGEWFLLMPAIKLASAIRDIELIAMAEAIANDEDELYKRRITDDWDVNYLQQTVSEAVSGIREPYRHVPYEQYMQERDALDTSR